MIEQTDMFRLCVENATARVEAMDRIDGFRDRFLRTIHEALGAGLHEMELGREDFRASLYDAYVMLGDLVQGRDPVRLDESGIRF